MAELSLRGHLTAEHHAAFAQELVRQKYDAHFGSTTVATHPAAVWLALALLLGLGGHRAYWMGYEWMHFGHVHFVAMDWVMAAVIALCALPLLRGRRGTAITVTPEAVANHCIEDVTVGPVRVEADKEGLLMAFGLRETRYDWPVFLNVSEAGGSLHLQTSSMAGVIIPDNAFADDRQRDAVLDLAQRQIAAAA